jgi:hypothetical protein
MEKGEIHRDFYSSHDFFFCIEKWRLRWAGHEAQIQRHPEFWMYFSESGHFENQEGDCWRNVKMHLMGKGFQGVNWF